MKRALTLVMTAGALATAGLTTGCSAIPGQQRVTETVTATPSQGASTSAEGIGTFYQTADLCGAGEFVGDEGKSLSYDTAADVDNSINAKTEVLRCILDKLKMPDSVRQHLGSTSAADGQQTDSWDGIDARWSVSATEYTTTVEITFALRD